MRFQINSRQDESSQGTKDFDYQRIDRDAVYIRQTPVEIIGSRAEQQPGHRLSCPGQCEKKRQSVPNLGIAMSKPDGCGGRTNHGCGTEVMDDLDQRIDQILHCLSLPLPNYLTVTVVDPWTPVRAWLTVASFTTMVCLPGDSTGKSMLQGQLLIFRSMMGLWSST